MEPGTIFFSYSRKDAESFAFKLANDLRAAGAKVWIDQLDIPPGKNWDEEIEKALNASKYILFIASEKSVSSQNVLNEIYYAVDENKIVIPIKIDDCAIPFRIRRFQYIDFTGNYDSAFDRLVKYLEANNEEFKAESNQPLQPVKPQIVQETEPTVQQISEHNEDRPESFEKEVTSVNFRTQHETGMSENRKPVTKYMMLGIVVLIAAVAIFLYWFLSRDQDSDNLSRTVSSNDSTSVTIDSNQRMTADTNSNSKTDTARAIAKNSTPDRDKGSTGETRIPLSEQASEHLTAEVDAHYEGGRVAWQNYINRSLRYPKEARDERIQGTVTVRFMIDTAGNVSDVTAVGGPMGGGLRREAIRVVQGSGKWVPALRNGRKVRIYKKLAIPFKL
ncbi:MAG TPA: TonB family protein [Flavitalea sp.]|nr:TonB family protein [Flavitalea sp.]